MKSVGIDPGTLSWSFYGIENGKEILNVKIPTVEREKVNKMAEEVVRQQFDIIIAPSGYGCPLKSLKELLYVEKERIFLKSKGELRKQIPKIGMDQVLEILKPVGEKTFLIPGVKHFETVPWYRKINRIDMGTADKVAAAFYSFNRIMKEGDLDPIKISFIHSELGFAFNAFISVYQGKIVDGIGGSYSTFGFLGGGGLDSEVACSLKEVSKSVVFDGGVLSLKKDLNSPELLQKVDSDLWEAYIEGIHKDILRASVSVPDCDTIVLSGRYAAEKNIIERLKSMLPRYSIFSFHERDQIASNAAKGAAMIGLGLLGTQYQDVIEFLEIRNTDGSVFDWVLYDGLEKF